MTTPNLAAFLSMISHAEGTDRAPDPYRVVYGYSTTLKSLADHPFYTGEWKGGLITEGVYAGELSTAAGRYQINHTTWAECQGELHLPNFTGPCQDDAAVLLIKRAGALDLVNTGEIEAAIAKCNSVWASLPGGTSGQRELEVAVLLTAYRQAGGAVA